MLVIVILIDAEVGVAIAADPGTAIVSAPCLAFDAIRIACSAHHVTRIVIAAIGASIGGRLAVDELTGTVHIVGVPGFGVVIRAAAEISVAITADPDTAFILAPSLALDAVGVAIAAHRVSTMRVATIGAAAGGGFAVDEPTGTVHIVLVIHYCIAIYIRLPIYRTPAHHKVRAASVAYPDSARIVRPVASLDARPLRQLARDTHATHRVDPTESAP